MAEVSWGRPYLALSKRARGVLLVLAILIATTALATLFHAQAVIASIGLALTFAMLTIFAFAHAILTFIHRLRPANNALFALKRFVTEASTLFRALVLGVALWVSDVYVALCQGTLAQLSDAADFNLIVTVLGIAIGCFDWADEKGHSAARPWARLYTASGYLFFFANITQLASATVDSAIFGAIVRLFQWPPWIFSAVARHIAADALGILFSPVVVILLVFFLLFWGCIAEPKIPHLEDDARAARLGFTVYLLWLFSVPIWLVAEAIGS